MRPHETVRGRILYTSRKPDREGVERGREYFTITRHRDGRRTLRAHAEIDDAPNVLRDVTLTTDRNWTTRDAFVRLSVGDETMGTSWFRFDDTFAECEGWTSERGRISERVEYDRPPALFGTHPIQGDAWHLNAVDRSNGPVVQEFDAFLMSSLDHRGATGPSLVWHDPGMKIEYVGEDRITVGAGTFDAWQFLLRRSRQCRARGERAGVAPAVRGLDHGRRRFHPAQGVRHRLHDDPLRAHGARAHAG